MALIKCKECGHMISEKALACPKCGYSVEKGNNLLEEKGNINKNSPTPSKTVGKKWRLSDTLWLVIPILGIIFGIIYENAKSSSSDSASSTVSYSNIVASKDVLSASDGFRTPLILDSVFPSKYFCSSGSSPIISLYGSS